MKNSYSFENKTDYLLMTVSGNYDYWNFVEFPKHILQMCESENVYRVLINGLNVNPEELPVIERFFMAEQAAEILRNRVKLAIVWHKDYIDGFMETVAINRAGLLRIFGNAEAAKIWLLDNSELPGTFF